MKSESVTRPLLRYHGGKWILAPWIISNFPPHRVYVEPFGGAASVLLRHPRSYAEVYNDLDQEICNVFHVVRDFPGRISREILWTPFSRDEYRRSFEQCDDPVEMARRTIIRSFMGFGSNSINRDIRSGFRSNSNRSGTTPAHDWANYPLTLRRVAKRLRGVVIENRNAIELMEQHDSEETLFYCDPPYVHSTRSLQVMHGHHGYAHEMSDANHEELAAFLGQVKGMVVLSGYHSDLYDRLYSGWHQVERGALADGAAPRTEVLWINRLARDGLLTDRSRGSLFVW